MKLKYATRLTRGSPGSTAVTEVIGLPRLTSNENRLNCHCQRKMN